MDSWIRSRLGPPNATVTLGNKTKRFTSPECLQKVRRDTAYFLLSWCYSSMITIQVAMVKTSESHWIRSSTSGRRSGGTYLWRSLRMTKCNDRLLSHLYLSPFPSPSCWSLLSTCILGMLWLPALYGFRNLLMRNNNNKQMKEVIENITGHNFNKCWLLSLYSLVFIILYTANRSKCFVFLTNISCNHKLTHFSAKSDISS